MANKEFSDVKINVVFTEATVPSGTNPINIDGSTTSPHTNGQDLALALGIIKSWYSHWHSVVWTGDADTVNSHTVESDVPQNAEFTDTTYSNGAGITIDTSNGNAINHSNSVTAGTAKGDDSKTLTFGGTFTIPTVTYDAQGHITSKGTTTMTMPANPNEDTKVNVTKANTTKAYLLGTSTTPTGTAQAVTSLADTGVYLSTTAGEIVATNFSGKINNHTVDADVPSNAVFTDTNTTYSFTGAVDGAYFQVSVDNGTPDNIYILGLGTMAFQSTSNFVPAKPDGTHDFLDSSTHIINSEYLPSYVDDVIEGYYNPTDHKFYTTRTGTAPNYSYSGEITGETGKIYLDLGADEGYRWGGSAYVSLKQPTLTGVADVVAGTNNGDITVSYNDGSTPSTFTVYSPEGNFIPSGGSSGQILGWSSSGTAAWVNAPSVSVFTGAPDSSHAGTSGVVPAPAASTYSSTTNRHYLRSDATWSDDPVIPSDTLTLNVVAGS